MAKLMTETIPSESRPNRTPLLTLYGTTLISVTGDAMAAIAIPWYVLQTTGSAADTGITAFFSILPVIIGMFFGGTLVDRIGYMRVSVFADYASGATLLLIPILHSTVGLAFWQLLALVFMGNLLDAPGRSAKRSMLPEISEVAQVSIDRSSSLMSAISRATTMIGAPLAGLLVIAVGPTGVILIDAITFFVSALGIQFLIPSKLVTADKRTESNYLQDLKAGFQYVRRDSLIMTLILVIMFTNMIDTAMSAVTLPFFTKSLFGIEEGAAYQGLLVGTFGASTLLGVLLYSMFGQRYNRRRLFIFAFFQVGLRFIIYTFFPSFWVVLFTIAIGGVLSGPINPIIDALMYRRVPQEMRARVFGFLSAGVLTAMPLGGLLAGYLLENLGLQVTFFIYAVVYLVSTGSLWFNPSMRNFETTTTAVHQSDLAKTLPQN
jgi:MFS family permease